MAAGAQGPEINDIAGAMIAKRNIRIDAARELLKRRRGQ